MQNITGYKFIGKIGVPDVWKVKEEEIARDRCDNLEERNKYWMNEDGKLCKLCLLKEGTIKHHVEECQKLDRIKHRRHNGRPK